MVDLSQFNAAKSDQLNADDLRPDGRLGGPITVRVTKVVGTNDKEQPIAVHYDGDGGRPYKPGKSMRRALVRFWGKDGEAYVGRWLTLYCDPEVTFGKIKVGGVRISGMSHIDETEMALAATKGAKRLFKVSRLNPEQRQEQLGGGQSRPKMSPEEQVDAYIDAIGKLGTIEELREYQLDDRRSAWRDGIKDKYPELFARIVEAQSARAAQLAPPVEGDDEGDGAGDPAGDPGASDRQDDDDDGFPA